MSKNGKFSRLFLTTSLTLTLSLCSCTSPMIGSKESGSSNSITDNSSDNSNLAASFGPDTTEATNGTINLNSQSRKLNFNEKIKEDESYYYYCFNSKLWRTSKENPDETVCLFPNDGLDLQASHPDNILIYNDNIYLIGEDLADYNEYVYRIDKNGAISKLSYKTKVGYTSGIDIHNGALYVYSFDLDNNILFEGYKINDDGSLGEECANFSDLNLSLGDNLVPVHLSFGDYIYSPSSIDYYGGIYTTDSAGNQASLYFIPKDNNNARKIADISGDDVAAITKDKLVMIQSNNLIDNNLYTIDINSGERSDLLTKEELKSMGYAHSSYFSVIDYDDNNIFVMIRHPLTENPVPNHVYDILKISLSDGSIEPLVNITEGEDPDNDFGLKVLNFTKDGLMYLNYADSSYSLCYMPYDNMSSQIVLASPDYGLESSVGILEQYGITFKTLHNAYFYTDDNYDVMTFYSDLVVPQLPATSDDFISFNETILDNLDVTDMAKSSVKEAGEIALSQDAYDEYSPMDIYPYNYTYRYAGLSYYDSRYVCLTTSDYQYWGGAHGIGWQYSYTLDMQDGKILALSDVIGQSQSEFVELVCDHVYDLDEGSLFSGYDGTIEQIRDSYTDNDFNWFLTPEGVGVRFASYEISPYAEGYPQIIVPYDELTLLINLGN